LRLLNTGHGGLIETKHEVLAIITMETAKYFVLPEHSQPYQPMSMVVRMDTRTSIYLTDMKLTPSTPVSQAMYESTLTARIGKFIKPRTAPAPIDGWPAFDILGPGPDISRYRPEEAFFNAPFAVWSTTGESKSEQLCQPISLVEILQLLGCSKEHMDRIKHLDNQMLLERARAAIGMHGLAALLQSLYYAEQADQPDPANSQPSTTAFTIIADDKGSCIKLPDDNDWKLATQNDCDLATITNADALQDINIAQFVEKLYYQKIQENRIEVEDGIVYHYELSTAARARQIRVRVVPQALRRVVVVACHSSPLAGHSGIKRTLFRAQARFWWPGMTRDITQGVRSCAHCNLANAASHEAQMQLQTLSCDTPFDVVFLDFWSPGEVMDIEGNVKLLTYLDCMTGFASGTFLSFEDTDSKAVANAAMAAFFTSYGLPRLLIVDADSLFAGTFLQLFQLLGIPVQAVSRENHKAIRNERFHRYLNKVQRINTADTNSMFLWKQGALFALYAWNAGPVDGTDIARSTVAMGRDFPFPIDLTTAHSHDGMAEGQHALEYFDAAAPLLYKQRDLLNILNAERRLRHTELRNEGIKQIVFDIGDLVVVRKQVKSNAAKGFSAKLVFKTKGPYRVIDKVNHGSYMLQKLPFLHGMGQQGHLRKKSAARMTKIPSTLILHQKPDGVDSRLMRMNGTLAESPLEKWLGLLKCGSYESATSDKTYAFEKFDSMWTDPLMKQTPQMKTIKTTMWTVMMKHRILHHYLP